MIARIAAIDTIFLYSRPAREAQPWNRALSYSGFAHAALIAFLLLMKATQAPFPVAVLTEVNLIERPAAPAAAVRQPVAAANETARGVPRGVSPDSQVLKSRLEVNASGAAPAGTGTTDAAGAKAGTTAGSVAPLSGPIVTSETLGFVGRRTGALVELTHRAGGATGAAVAGLPRGSQKSAEPIALGKMGVDEIRRRESSIGTPLVSENVLADGIGVLGGRGKGLANAADGAEKRRAALESLKANPLDDDKWGKQKGPFSMEGPLKYRKILKMELPPYPRWAEEKAIEASVSIRLWVDARGRVKDNMYLEKTSGYSELDHVAMEALKGFLFVSIPAGASQEDEWGVATFRFELKR